MLAESFLEFAVAFCRALGLVAFLPLSNMSNSLSIKTALTIILALAVPSIQFTSVFDFLLQFLLGFSIAFPLVILIEGIDLAVDMLESLRGQTLGNFVDPISMHESNALSAISKPLAWVLLLELGALERMFVSFVSFPENNFWDSSFWPRMLQVFNNIFSAAFEFLFIAAIIFLMIELLILCFSAMLPRVSLQNEAYFIKWLLVSVALLTLLNSNFLDSLSITLGRFLNEGA